MKAILALLLVSSVVVCAQDSNDFQKDNFKSKGDFVLPYRILWPENYDRSKKYPVVLFLHGAGERGSDNEKQLVHGSKLFLNKQVRQKFPAIVIFPQCAAESYWSSVKIDRSKSPTSFNFDYKQSETLPLQAAIELLKKIISTEGVDQDRIYITGLSMGGMGTFEAVYRYPKLFAAALPICGGGDSESYTKKNRKTKFWIFHGSADAVVGVENSRKMNDRLKELKVTVKYTEYSGVNHNSWDNAFAEPDFLDWMFAQRK